MVLCHVLESDACEAKLDDLGLVQQLLEEGKGTRKLRFILCVTQ